MLFNFVFGSFVRLFKLKVLWLLCVHCVCCCLIIGIGWSSNWMSNYRYKCVDEGNFINLVLSLLFSSRLVSLGWPSLSCSLTSNDPRILFCSLLSLYIPSICFCALCVCLFFIILKNGWEKYPIKCRMKHIQPFFLFLFTYFECVCVCLLRPCMTFLIESWPFSPCCRCRCDFYILTSLQLFVYKSRNTLLLLLAMGV